MYTLYVYIYTHISHMYIYSMIYLSKLGIVGTNNDSEHVPTTAVLHQFVMQLQTLKPDVTHVLVVYLVAMLT